MADIPTVIDSKRGCGWRTPGGLYMITAGEALSCGLLPLMLHNCPACGHGFKPTRSYQPIEPARLWLDLPERCGLEICGSCPLAFPHIATLGKAWLMWCGKSYYPTPESWLKEAREQGVSRRINAIPKGFMLGHSWVFMAHEKAVPTADLFQREGYEPGEITGAVYSVFKPEAIQYVVKGDEPEDELERMRERGITPVHVVRDTDKEAAA